MTERQFDAMVRENRRLFEEGEPPPNNPAEWVEASLSFDATSVDQLRVGVLLDQARSALQILAEMGFEDEVAGIMDGMSWQDLTAKLGG